MKNNSTLQEAKSLSNFFQDWMIYIATLELQAFLDGNMYKVMTDMVNKSAKWYPRIKLMIFWCNVKGGNLDRSISPGVASYFVFFLCLPRHYWCPVSDEVQVLSSLAKVLHFPGSSMKFTNCADPCTPERQTIIFEKETDGSESNNGSQSNNGALAKTTHPSKSYAFSSPRMSKLFKK